MKRPVTNEKSQAFFLYIILKIVYNSEITKGKGRGSA